MPPIAGLHRLLFLSPQFNDEARLLASGVVGQVETTAPLIFPPPGVPLTPSALGL